MSAEAEDDAFISVFISAERSDVSENPAERTVSGLFEASLH